MVCQFLCWVSFEWVRKTLKREIFSDQIGTFSRLKMLAPGQERSRRDKRHRGGGTRAAVRARCGRSDIRTTIPGDRPSKFSKDARLIAWRATIEPLPVTALVFAGETLPHRHKSTRNTLITSILPAAQQGENDSPVRSSF